jgi:hypothetical protein
LERANVVRRFFITVSVSLLVTDLLKLFIYSWFNLGGSYVSRNVSISSWFSSLLEYIGFQNIYVWSEFHWCFNISFFIISYYINLVLLLSSFG